MDTRASDAERDATVDRLREAAAEGRLTLEELTDRIEAAANAVMRSDLVPLTSALPDAHVHVSATLGIRGERVPPRSRAGGRTRHHDCITLRSSRQ
jgi:hypothetical protein